jgi:hypothetical protein
MPLFQGPKVKPIETATYRLSTISRKLVADMFVQVLLLIGFWVCEFVGAPFEP